MADILPGACPIASCGTPREADPSEVLRGGYQLITRALPGQPLRVSAPVVDAAAVRSLRLRYRHVTQFEDYATLEMLPVGEPGEFAATIPGEFIVPEWDLMYFFEIVDVQGNGMNRPDVLKGLPYVIVKVAR